MMVEVIKSFALMLAAVVLMIGGAAEPDATDALAGTKWVDEDGYLYQFTKDGKRFHNWGLAIVYQQLDDGYYHNTAINADGLITFIGYPLISFAQDTGILTMTITYENRDPYIVYYHALADDANLGGTRWLHENGSVYTFSEDATLFTSKDDPTILCMAYEVGIYHDCTFHTQYEFYRANNAAETTFTIVDGMLIQATTLNGTSTEVRYIPAP